MNMQSSSSSTHALASMRRSPTTGVLWSRKDIGEMFEGCLSPLGRSFTEYYRSEVHPLSVRRMGLRYGGEPHEYYRIERGYVYANVAYFEHLFSQSPAGRNLGKFVRAFASGEVDVRQYQNPYGAHPDADHVRTFACWMAWQGCTLARVARASRSQPNLDAARARVRELQARQVGDARLHSEVEQALGRFREAYADYFPVVLNAFVLQSALLALYRARGGADINAIEAWSRDRLDARAAERAALAVLAACLATRPAWVASLTSGASHSMSANDPTVVGIREECEVFLREYGASGTVEMDLARSRYEDDPRLVRAAVLRAWSAPQSSAPISLSEALCGAHLAVADLASVLALARLLEWHERARVGLRKKVVNAIWEVRALLAEAARRFGLRGQLRQQHDFANVTLHELLDGLMGKPFGAPARFESRRLRYLAECEIDAPATSFIA